MAGADKVIVPKGKAVKLVQGNVFRDRNIRLSGQLADVRRKNRSRI